ncbi:MAG: prepilin-type N-terminal cleavage/methylation domain-containing protein [Thermoguttaceae bacterium]
MRGFTLLEILVSLSILLIGLLAVSKLSDLAQRESLSAEELATVQLATQTKMNEVLVHVGQPIVPILAEPISGVRDWSLSLQVFPTARSGLSAVHIRAEKAGLSRQPDFSERFDLVRWVLTKN